MTRCPLRVRWPRPRPAGPQVEVLLDRLGAPAGRPTLVNTGGESFAGDFPPAVVEAVDAGSVGMDPLAPSLWVCG
jgi:hypothetical protein